MTSGASIDGVERRLFEWASWAVVFLIFILVAPLIIPTLRSSLGCAVSVDPYESCRVGSRELGGQLGVVADIISAASSILTPFLGAFQLGWTVLAIRRLMRWFQGHGDWIGVATTRRRIIGAATLTTLVGLAPMIANLISEFAASRLGCFVNEHGAYTMTDGDTIFGCRRGTTEVGGLLHDLYMSVMLFFITWPLIPIGSYLWIRLVRDRVRHARASKNQ